MFGSAARIIARGRLAGDRAEGLQAVGGQAFADAHTVIDLSPLHALLTDGGFDAMEVLSGPTASDNQ